MRVYTPTHACVRHCRSVALEIGVHLVDWIFAGVPGLMRCPGLCSGPVLVDDRLLKGRPGIRVDPRPRMRCTGQMTWMLWRVSTGRGAGLGAGLTGTGVLLNNR